MQDFAIMEQVLGAGSSSSVDGRGCGNTDFQVSGDTVGSVTERSGARASAAGGAGRVCVCGGGE